jgi:hypothetical protein
MLVVAGTIFGVWVECQRRRDRFLRLAEHHEASSRAVELRLR